MVEITQDASRSSVYSVRVGRKPKEGEDRLNPNIPIFLRTDLGKVEIKAPFVPDTIQSLLEQAEGWIADRAQAETDVRLEKMQAHESRRDHKDAPKVIRSPGKTERDRSKGKRQ